MADYKNEFGVFGEKPQVPKKIFDAKYVFAGLVIFFVLVTLPLWPNLGKTVPTPQPKLDTPAIQKLAEKDRKCVMPTDWMRANHMQLLIDWREGVVRSKEKGGPDERLFVNPDGKKFTASLTNTCMNCHSDKAEFCDKCHNFVAVVPNCWGCHQEPAKKMAEAK